MARMTKRRKGEARAKRSTYITPRASGYAQPLRDYWPITKLSPLPTRPPLHYQPVLSGRVPPAMSRGRGRQPPRVRVSRNIKSLISGMHDTPFKRPTIAPYGAWSKGLGYLLPPRVKVCVQRKQRREALFAQTGGGSIRRKSTNRRDLRSQLRCK